MMSFVITCAVRTVTRISHLGCLVVESVPRVAAQVLEISIVFTARGFPVTVVALDSALHAPAFGSTEDYGLRIVVCPCV